jgi:hypothetical protein
MRLSDIPAKFITPWAFEADAGTIRTVPQTPPSQAGAASWQEGWPSITFIQVASGGVPPFGQDMQGLMNVVTAWSRWAQAGGAQPYDGTFASEIGGYPKSALLPAATQAGVWYSLADNNLSDPDTGGANWALIGPNMTVGALGGDITGTIADAIIKAGVVTGAKTALNTITNANLANMPANTFKGRLATAGAPQDLTAPQMLGGLGLTGGANIAYYPQAGGLVLVRQWGQGAAISDGTVVTVTLAVNLTIFSGVNLTTLSDAGATDNAVAMLVTGSNVPGPPSTFQVKMQNLTGAGGVLQPYQWEAFGYL